MEIVEPQAAVAILQTREPRHSFLLIRRSERPEDSWSGHWSLPGGRRDATDSDLLHTALRELEEECGIRLHREHMQSALSPVVARRRTGPFLLVAPFVFNVEDELPTVVDPEEAVEAIWVPIRVLRNPAMHSLRSVPGVPKNWLFPAVEIKGHPLWGFTYRLMTDWLDLLPAHSTIHDAGFQMACRVLDFLVSHNLTIQRPWHDAVPHSEPSERKPAKIAEVEGVIPVDLVIAHFSAPSELFPSVNLLQVRPDSILVVGLDFEEYLISSIIPQEA